MNIGVLGGGQLGRMTGYAARSLGYDVHVLDPDPACPASAIGTATTARAKASVSRIRNEPPGRIGSVPVTTAAAMRAHTPTATTISCDSVSGITRSTRQFQSTTNTQSLFIMT